MHRLALGWLALGLSSSFTHGGLVITQGSALHDFDPGYGLGVEVADSGLNTGLNGQFVIDSATGTGYRLGLNGGIRRISTIDLNRGTSTISNATTGTPALAILNGQLIGSYGSDIRTIDPVSGTHTFLATSGLENNVNNQFVVDEANQLGYQIGAIGGSRFLSTIDLVNGGTQVVPFSDLLALAVYNGTLLGVDDTLVSTIDPATGFLTPLTSTGLDVGINYELAIDQGAGLLYVLGGLRNGAFTARHISTVDLEAGTAIVTPVPGIPALAVYSPIPEPAPAALVGLVALVSLGHRRRKG